MGWQDRDYARGAQSGRPVWVQRSDAGGAGRSIVTTLIIVNVVIHVVANFFPQLGEWIFGYGAMQGAAVLHGQLWRLVTAQYLHAGMGHLLINMLVLHFLGRSLERMWSTRKFLVIYTLCGVAGNLFFTLLAAQGVIDSRMPAVGASGCIFGLLGIVAVLFPHATIYIYFLFPMKIRTAAYIFAGIAFFSIVSRGANYGGEACHLAGLVFGVWWAMKGDTWWETRGRYRFSGKMSRRSPSPRKPSVKRPKGFAAKIAERREDAETIDRILKKVYEGGIHSLTGSEKKALQSATERQREREGDSGRVDRL